MTRTARTILILAGANAAVYFVVLACWLLRPVVPALADTVAHALVLPAEASTLASHPLSVITYSFTHLSFVHLTVNMLWLAGIGAMLRGTWRQALAVYLSGAVAGALFFVGYANLTGDTGATLAGASSAVIAIVTATVIITPERRVQLLPGRRVKLKWIAPVALLTLFTGLGAFSGATAAHLGGFLAGVCLGGAMRRADRLRSRRAARRSLQCAISSARRRLLLDKAAVSGFASLSDSERLELFDMTK